MQRENKGLHRAEKCMKLVGVVFQVRNNSERGGRWCFVCVLSLLAGMFFFSPRDRTEFSRCFASKVRAVPG